MNSTTLDFAKITLLKFNVSSDPSLTQIIVTEKGKLIKRQDTSKIFNDLTILRSRNTCEHGLLGFAFCQMVLKQRRSSEAIRKKVSFMLLSSKSIASR